MSSQFTQGPGRPTRNSQQAGIASALLSFGRRRASPPRNVLGLEVDTSITEVPTVVRTPATPVHPLSPNNPFRATVEDEHEFSTTITQPVFQSPARNALDLPAEYAGEPTESSVTDESAYLRYQGQLTDTLRIMTDRLAALSTQPPTHHAPSELRPRVKPRSPDPFDGSDPNKLDTFLFQCGMYISLRGHDFPDESYQVAFMLSHLKGSALDWFQSAVTHGASSITSVAWLSSTTLFTDELRRLFGPRDPTNDAIIRLESLKYKDSGKAVKYTLDFNRDAPRTGWNDNALYRQFYKGLPDRLKDELARIGKPPTLILLQHQIQILDQRHWERQSEISRDKRTTSTSAPTRPDNSKTSTPANSSSSSKTAAATPQSSAQKTSTSSSSSSSTKAKNPHADKLGKNGKLTAEERDRRFKLQLCLFCGLSGHKVTDCPSAKNSAKGKASSTTPVDAKSAKE